MRRDPDYSDAWAMLGYLHMDAGRFGYADDVGPAEHYARAAEAAARAVELEPTNALALKALAAINHYQGNYDRSESLARRALKQILMIPTRWSSWDGGSRSAAISKRAFRSSNARLRAQPIHRAGTITCWPSTVSWMAMGPPCSTRPDTRRPTGSALSQSLVAMAYGLIGDEAAAQDALRRMIESRPAMDPIARFQTHHVTEEILETITAALDRAGWSSPS